MNGLRYIRKQCNFSLSQLADEEIAQAGRAVQMFEIEIEHLSGKEVQEK